MADKHTLRANALAAMHATGALDWAQTILASRRAAPSISSASDEDTATRAEYKQAIGTIELQIEDEMLRCHEALTKYYAQ
jgi:hypothetical protein